MICTSCRYAKKVGPVLCCEHPAAYRPHGMAPACAVEVHPAGGCAGQRWRKR